MSKASMSNRSSVMCTALTVVVPGISGSSVNVMFVSVVKAELTGRWNPQDRQVAGRMAGFVFPPHPALPFPIDY
jgi:hypothetical protein